MTIRQHRSLCKDGNVCNISIRAWDSQRMRTAAHVACMHNVGYSDPIFKIKYSRESPPVIQHAEQVKDMRHSPTERERVAGYRRGRQEKGCPL